MFRFSLIFVTSSVVLATPLCAQDMPIIDMSGFTNSINLQAAQNLSNQVSDAYMESAPEKRQSATHISTPNKSSLRYKPSKSLRQQNLQNFIKKTRATDPTGAARMQEIFASTDVIAQIDQMMRPMGLNANNVADAYTLWWVIAWHAANGREGTPNRQIMIAVKMQAEAALLAAPQFIAASNSQKQEIAEVFLVQAALIDSASEVYANSPKQKAALARAVNRGAMAMDRDLDLTKMTLTQDGFVPRSAGRSDASEAAGDDSQLAANDDGAQADGASMGDYALYAVAGTGLLAGMFALGKGFSKKG